MVSRALKGSSRRATPFEESKPYLERSGMLELVDYSDDLKATLLGSDAVLEVKNNEGKAEIIFPAINPDSVDSDWLYTIKLSK